MIRITLSKKLGELRVTQSELASATGIRQNTINDLYHDVTDRVSLEQLDKICEALDCDLWESLVSHKLEGTPVYDFIQKKRSEGKCGKEAMIAGLNKFLRIYYGKVMELYSII